MGFCEKECLSLMWAIQRCKYLTGMSQIVLQSVHSPIKFIVSGKTGKGHISNTSLSQWMLWLNMKGVTFQKIPKPAIAPLGLLVRVLCMSALCCLFFFRYSHYFLWILTLKRHLKFLTHKYGLLMALSIMSRENLSLGVLR